MARKTATVVEPDERDQEFEALEVIATAIEIPNAGGGLQEALGVDPVTFHHGDEFHIVMRCRVGKVRFDPIPARDDDGKVIEDEIAGLKRVHISKAKSATIVEAELVEDHLAAQEKRIRLAKEDNEGILHLDGTGDL